MRWLGEQVSGVADQLDEDLEKVRVQMQNMEEELIRAKGSTASMATRGQQSNVDTQPVVTTKQKATPEPAVDNALKTGTESAWELKALRQELAA